MLRRNTFTGATCNAVGPKAHLCGSGFALAICTDSHIMCLALSAAGVDDVDSYEELCSFIQTVSEGSGVTHFIMHARKCLLNGLTPLQNRTIPPLK